MSSAPIELPEDPEALRALALRQHAELAEQAEQIRQLEEYVRLLKHQRFGRSSERHPEAQLGLFNEAEALTDAADKEEEASGILIAAHTRRPRGGRRPLPRVSVRGPSRSRSVRASIGTASCAAPRTKARARSCARSGSSTTWRASARVRAGLLSLIPSE